MRITLTQEIASSSAAKAPQSPLSLEQGEVIRATVVSVEGENVSFKTEDGRVFSARLQPGTVLMEHDTVELMAGGERQQQVLRVVFVEPGQSGIPMRENAAATTQAALTQQLKEAFGQMNIRPTPKLISLAAEILKNYPADAKAAAFFAANNIPATNESIHAFQSILNGKQFGTAFYEVAQGAASALEQFIAAAAAEHIETPFVQNQPGSSAQSSPNPSAAVPEGQPAILQAVQIETGAALQGQQAQVIPQQGDAALTQPESKAQILTGQQQMEAGQPQGQAPTQPQGQTPAQLQIKGAPVTGQNPVLFMPENVAAETGKTLIQPQAGIALPRDASATETPAPALQGEQAADQVIQEQPVLQQADLNSTAKQTQSQQAVSNGITGEAQPHLTGQPNVQPQAEAVIKESGNPLGAKQASVLGKSAHTADAAATYAATQDESAELPPGPVPKESSDLPNAAKGEGKAVLKQLLELFAKAGEDLDAQTLKKSVEETPQKLLELQKLIKNTDIHTQETLTSRFQELTAQAKLAEDISRFVFVQVPIHLKEYGSAELYIYKRNRREKGAERQSTSVVLGLSTQNLGRVEAMLRMENRDLSLDIRVQNESAQKAFREGMNELQRSFSELRFQLKEYKVSPLREKTTPLNAEEKLKRMHAPSGVGVDVII